MENEKFTIRKFSFLTDDLKTITIIQESAVEIQKNEEGEIVEEKLMGRELVREDNEDYELEGDENSIEATEEELSKLEALEREFQKIIYQHYSYNDLVREYNAVEDKIYRGKKETAEKEYELKILEALIMVKGEKIERGEINE